MAFEVGESSSGGPALGGEEILSATARARERGIGRTGRACGFESRMSCGRRAEGLVGDDVASDSSSRTGRFAGRHPHLKLAVP